jgi:hypothetical protein
MSVVAPSPRFKANLARFRAALTRCRNAIELATGMADDGRREPRRTAQARLTA